MRLTELTISGLRCYASSITLPMHSLTVLIGENDSGKSTVVRALQLLLSQLNPSVDDYAQEADGHAASRFELTGRFVLDDSWDVGGFDFEENGTRFLVIRKSYSVTGRPQCCIYGEVYEDDRFNTYQDQNANDLKALVRSLGLESRNTKAENVSIITQHLDRTPLPKLLSWKEVNFGVLEAYLPHFETILSTDYKDPSAIIQGSIQATMQERVRQIETEGHTLHGAANTIKAWVEGQVDDEAEGLPAAVNASLPSLRGVKISARVDFSRLVAVTSVALDMGRGYHPLASFGEGTRKKLWMSLLESRQQSQDESRLSRPVLRVYDEPDLNLDYAAEKRLFDYISNSSKAEGSKVQNILCTHSVTLVDRAPPECISLIRVQEDGARHIENLSTVGGASVESRIRAFFDSIGTQLQIRNTELFYEKGYLVCEGETEEELLPLLYRRVFGRTVVEDGIRLLNMHTCGNWRTTLEFLGTNRMQKTVILLDRDATFPASSARITEQSLRDIGFVDGMHFVGTKELEDAFDDTAIAEALQCEFPRDDGQSWMPEHIHLIRNNTLSADPKFSEDLKNFVKSTVIPQKRNEVKKVSIGRCLGLHCDLGRIPPEIRDALQAVRQRAGIA
ncbi:AAA family ATPase [Deinococcus radiotolerans]|uniref:AAA domain-containing protein n=1 Tax=Deinococcus radiotolerans TaxID=1309407 RepID=A0ABQ2FP78_9DEIO|nr:AAA family ATPase [Deinococcus radiotolerans]GGL13199.1 hypothetical protein GCM10010844_35000 [Deinococcus radiotolerans]